MTIKKEAGVICLHFDVTEHQIPLKQFIDVAKSAEGIIDNFNKEFFEGKLEYEINVIPPKDGGFIDSLKVIVSAVPPIFLSFWDKDVRAGVIEGLTDKKPNEWAKDSTRDAKTECSNLVRDITSAFIQKEPNELQKLGVSKDKFRSAYNAKNTIYQGCLDNEDVNAIGFDTTHNFPIKRKDFQSYIVDMPLEPEETVEENDPKWIIETPDIIVNSPNWKRDGRKWQAKTEKFSDIAFSIEDETFWHRVKIKDIKPDINDNMKVQWAYPEGLSKPSNVKALRVLSYNGKKISDPLTEEELKKEFQEFTTDEQELDLFNYTSAQNNQQKVLLRLNGE